MQTIQDWVDALVGPGRLPGATVAVGLPGREVVRAAGGLGEVEGGEPMPRTARIFSGSVGKLFVSSLVLSLEAEGKLSLDEHVSKHLGEEEWFGRVPNSSAITIRHLLTHTSGVPDHVTNPAFWAEVLAAPDRRWTPEERVQFVLGDKPVCEPGAMFHYSDTNYILLGMIVERLAGRSWYAEAGARLLQPCALTETTPAEGRRIAGLVQGYGERLAEVGLAGRVLVDGEYLFDQQVEGAGGGFVTTSADLARFSRCLFEGRVLPAGSIERMTARIPLDTGLSDGAGYGLGTMIWETPLGAAFGHAGFVPGYNTLVEYFPNQGFAIALQTNTDAPAAKLGRSLHSVLVELAQAIAASGRSSV